jgi:hypothetical protein
MPAPTDANPRTTGEGEGRMLAQSQTAAGVNHPAQRPDAIKAAADADQAGSWQSACVL